MKFTINPQIFTQYPDVLLGVVILHDIDNHGDSPEITSMLRTAETACIDSFNNTPVIEHSHIAPWREAYRKFGAKPKDYPSSIENLVRRIIKGDSIRHINKLVDIYNYISLKHLVPVGGEDLSQIQGDIELTIAGDQEEPVVLLGESEARPPYAREVIYKDNLGTICRRWNWKEADRTKLTEKTQSALIVIEALPPVGKEQLDTSLAELANLVKQFCGGEITTTILDSQNPEITLTNKPAH
jgi:DNA/RNA-binding domain of Phe-tRNA-synthetase-like protein